MVKNSNKKIYKRGMTLIELIVVIAIFMIILGLTIFDYSSFKSSVTIQNLADDIALSVRKAQTFATGSKNPLIGVARGFGVHFVMTPSTPGETIDQAGSDKSFIIFSDITSDNGYDYKLNGNDKDFVCGDINNPPDKNNECIDLIKINTDAKIIGISLGDDYNLEKDESLDVTFVRPNPDALFCYKKNSKDSKCELDSKSLTFVTIKVASSKKDDNGKYLNQKEIIIRNTGQISVK